MVLSIKFIFKAEVEGHYPQENSFRYPFGTGPKKTLRSILQNRIKGLQAKDMESTVLIAPSLAVWILPILLVRLEGLKKVVQG
jgi:hypothetical protein